MAKFEGRSVSSRPYSGNGIPAAAYVRASTEQQIHSIENQLALIEGYAGKHGFEIVRTYEDAGRSGLRIDFMEAFKQLLEDVGSGEAPFEAILVYDVSRWGRFPNSDESAYYEHLCLLAGIAVHFCAEQFENDLSPGSQLLKSVRRVMAGEYSRALSASVFAGQRREIERGHRQGGTPGFGLRRMLVDRHGKHKIELQPGERKSLRSEGVILVPGPAAETSTVRRIYQMFTEEGKSEREIADLLNTVGLPSDLGRSWTSGTIRQILRNEKYIGNNVYNRVSFKLKVKRVRNSPDMWIRVEGAFEPIVEKALFERARAIFDARSLLLSDQELLAMLQDALKEKGYLSGFVIDEIASMPSARVYLKRFGSLLRAYTMIGYDPGRDYRYIEANRELRKRHPEIVALLIDDLTRAGALVSQDPASELLRINEEFSIAVVLARANRTRAGSLRWKVRLDTGLVPDITIVMRMDEANQAALDYYLLPSIDLTDRKLTLAERNALSLDAYRFDSLDFFFDLARRFPIEDVA